ncbi:MAG: hypothetical protein ABEI86_03160, partial [Halobacteriaceae archaeon]
MSLDVAVPSPPSLESQQSLESYDDVSVSAEQNYRRDELQTFLESGAWEEGFHKWAETTDLTEDQFAIIEDLNLFGDFDFFWDEFAGRVGYHAPGIPEDWQQRDMNATLESWNNVSAINASLTELGREIADLLENEY